MTFSTSDGTATGGPTFDPPNNDYITVSSQVVTFNPGDTVQTVSVTIVGDFATEPDETFFGNLSGVSSNATIADAQGIGTILNDDSFFIGDATADEDAGTITFTVTRSGQPTTTATVDFATADGTASAGLDYLAASGTLVFAPGESEKTVTVTILDDTVFEAAEAFTVNLSNAIGDNIKDGEGIGTITGNDLAAALAAAAGSEGFDLDGLADVIIGAPYTGAGEAYVVFGTSSIDPGFDLSSLDGTEGFVINGVGSAETSSIEVSAAGDVNGDGVDDLLMDSVASAGNDHASVFVVFGGVGVGGAVSLSNLSSTGRVRSRRPISGTEAADTLNGSAAADAIVGGLGNDILVGGGGLDVLRGGAGDDILVIADAGFLRVDGGAEVSGGNGDTLRLASGNLNLSTIADNKVQGIENIDLEASGSGTNALTLQLSDVLDLSETSNTVVIFGGAGEGDTVATPGEAWSAGRHPTRRRHRLQSIHAGQRDVARRSRYHRHHGHHRDIAVVQGETPTPALILALLSCRPTSTWSRPPASPPAR